MIVFFLLFAFTISSCDKSGAAKDAEALPVTAIITNGSWLMTYTESGVEIDMGTTTTTFTKDGKVIANKNGSKFNGTWSEVRNDSEHTLTINFTTSDPNLLKTNGKWQIIIATASHIDITDPDLNKRHTVHFNK